MSEAIIGALAPWFGAKRAMAPTIVRQLGPHVAYWEPFCGSMAVLLAKPESRMETVNDLHKDVINLALVTQHPKLGAAFYRRCRRLIVADEQLCLADAQVRNAGPGDLPDLERAVAYFVVCWMGRNGESGLRPTERGRSLCVRWTPNGGDPATRFESAVASIPAWRRRLRNVTVLNRDGFDVLAKVGDDAGTAIYCDPPYLEKSDAYLHDFDAADHARLADLVRRFRKARVVVSYYEHPRLAELYPGWTLLPCPTRKRLVVPSGQKLKVAPEVLLINGEPLEGGLFR